MEAAEEAQNVMVEVAEVGLLGLLEVGGANLHGPEVACDVIGILPGAGLGWEGGVQSDHVGVEALDQKSQSQAEEAGGPVGQVGAVEVQQL